MMDYDSLLNPLIKEIKPSGIRRFFDIAAEMDNVISLSVGEPDFKTPWHVREEGITTLQKGKTRYSPNSGFTDLLNEISNYYDRRFGLKYEPKGEIIVTVGGSEAIDLCVRSLVSEGDEVQQVIMQVALATSKRGIYVYDRGGDGDVMFAFFLENALDFIVRLVGDRHLVDWGTRKVLARDLAAHQTR